MESAILSSQELSIAFNLSKLHAKSQRMRAENCMEFPDNLRSHKSPHFNCKEKTKGKIPFLYAFKNYLMFSLNIYLNPILICSTDNLQTLLNPKYACNVPSSCVILILHLPYRKVYSID